MTYVDSTKTTSSSVQLSISSSAYSYELSKCEQYWVGHWTFLESQGYRLRARYQPHSGDSWISEDVEDGITPSVRLVVILLD